MLAALQGREPLAWPATTAKARARSPPPGAGCSLAELDYSLTPHLMLAFIDTQRDATTCGSSSATSFPPSPGVSWAAVSAERAAALSRLLLKRPATPWTPNVPVYVQLGPFRVDGLG